MIPWPRFRVLSRQLPRLEATDALLTATGVAFGYLNARLPKDQRWKFEQAMKRLRRAADGEETEA